MLARIPCNAVQRQIREHVLLVGKFGTVNGIWRDRDQSEYLIQG